MKLILDYISHYKADSSNASLDTLLTYAQAREYSKLGELFTASYLVDIASHFGVSCQIRNDLQIRDIISNLLCGRVIAVAYDMGHDFRPALRQGSKAHWCLIHGFLYFEEGQGVITNIIDNVRSAESVDIPDLLEDQVWLIISHGKSKRRNLWSWVELKASTRNLVTVDQRLSDETYVIPNDRRLDGLRDQWVIFNVHTSRST